MSLLDALLLEGYRDPREIYIALRSDGQKGSGTIDDPYDGGKRLGLPLSGTLTCNRFRFVVGTQFPHGITSIGSPAPQVTISGFKGPPKDWFNGVFDVQEIVSPLHFTVQFAAAKTGTPPTNLPSAPPDVQYSYNGYAELVLPSGAKVGVQLYWPIATVTVPPGHGLDVFDGVTMGGASLPADYAGDYPILGPDGSSTNVFAYRLGFLPLADIMDGTTPDHLDCTVKRHHYRFDDVMRSVPAYSAIHVGPGEFETRGSAPMYLADENDWMLVHAGFVVRAGQRLLGSGIGATTLKLALPLDEINQTTAIGNFSNQLSTNADYFEASDFTVDCNAPGHLAPYGIFPAPVTCGAVTVRGSFMRLHRVRAINFCTQGSAECFVLFLPSGWGQAGTFNVIEDCILEQPGLNNTHETTLISSVGDNYGSALSPIVRHNYVNCTLVNSNGSRFSSEYIAIESITTPTASNQEFTVTTKRPHNRAEGQNVLINSVYGDASYQTSHPYFSQPFKIKALDSASPLTKFKCEFHYLQTDFPGNFPDAFFNPNFPPFLGVDFHGPSALSGTGCVTEGNAVFDCAQGLYTDTGSTRDLVVRNNYCSGGFLGVNFNFNPGVETPPRYAKSNPAGTYVSLKRDVNDHTIAIFESELPHLLKEGDAMDITGARIGTNPTNPNPPYNGTFTVLSLSSETVFKYRVNEELTADAEPPTTASPITFRARWQVRRLVCENNNFDLYAFDGNSALAPQGMQSVAFLGGPPFMFPSVVVRDNYFRHLDDAPATVAANGVHSFAFRIGSFENTQIEGNLIGLADPNLIHHYASGTVYGFNNRTPAGTLLGMFDDTQDGGTGPFRKEDSLEDRVADALLISFL